MPVSRIKEGEVSKNQSPRPPRTRKNFSVKSVFSKRFCGGACIQTTIFYMQRYNSQVYRGYVHATDEAITKCSYVTCSNKRQRKKEGEREREREHSASFSKKFGRNAKRLVVADYLAERDGDGGWIVSSVRKEFSLETEIIGGDVLSPIKLFPRLFE